MKNNNPSSSKKPKVMIVDDDVSTRMLLRASITQWGFEVIEACDGDEAYHKLLVEYPPLIIIVDWLMPNTDGLELCKKITESLYYHPYTLVLTHNKGTGNLVTAIECGADEFLEKPINLEELRCRLIVGTRIINGNYASLFKAFPFQPLNGEENE